MKTLKDRVAVITGAAEGIGKAIAQAAAAEGMHLVLADINGDLLAQTVSQFKTDGIDAIGVKTDVANADDVQALADAAFAAHGNVHLLVNNAGVAVAKSAWETTQQDWDWVMGINLYGVTHALRAFLPTMLAKGDEGHVVNTASLAGLISEPAMAAYNVSKFGVVTLSEGLFHDLALRNARVKVSVLCPAWVKTRITDSERNRAAEDRSDPSTLHPVSLQTGASIVRAVENGISPDKVAGAVIQAVKDERFYILTHARSKMAVQIRMEDIVNERDPTLLPI